MSSSQAPAVVEVAARYLAQRVAKAAANFTPRQIPASSTAFDGLRSMRSTQRQARMHQLRTGS